MSERFPHVICQRDFQLLMAPRLAYTDKEKGERGERKGERMHSTLQNASMCFGSLTAVESRDARIISRFPFSPSRAGTKINNSPMS